MWPFAVQTLGGHDELVGSDVNLLHRLLKNSIVEVTGIRAYTVLEMAASQGHGGAIQRRLVNVVAPRILPGAFATGLERLYRQLADSPSQQENPS